MFGSKCTTDDDIEDDNEDAEDAARGRSMVLLSSRDQNKAPPRRCVATECEDSKKSRQNLTHFEQPKAAKNGNNVDVRGGGMENPGGRASTRGGDESAIRAVLSPRVADE